MRIIYDPRHRHHRPKLEILYGKPLAHPDRVERVEAVRSALNGTHWATQIVGPREYPRSLSASVHEPEYLAHLEERCAEAAAEGPEEEWFPYVWPRDRGMDTGTPLQGVTLELAWASACVALTGADLILEGEPSAYALSRPPGHHAAAGALGGYCYLNNAALAAERLLSSASSRPGGGVAILDLDIHHGNGTQDIFYADDRVLYCSLHGEPEWCYPPHTGFAEQVGVGAGQGFTFNQPLPEATDWLAYSAALERALERIAAFGPAYLVLSQGYDTFEGDPWGGFLLHAEHYTRIGERVRSLGVPILAILEGGYEPSNVAAGSLALLGGISLP
ncbi:MAG: histone deacetylase family protein [Chloroflexota bacterium]